MSNREGVHPLLQIPALPRQYPAGTRFKAVIDCGKTKNVDESPSMETEAAAEEWVHGKIDALNADDSFDPVADDLLTYRIVLVAPGVDAHHKLTQR